MLLPKRIILFYGNNPFGKIQRKMTEFILLKAGYYVKTSKPIKKWNAKKAVGLGVVFLPLALFGKSEMTKVIYGKATKAKK